MSLCKCPRIAYVCMQACTHCGSFCSKAFCSEKVMSPSGTSSSSWMNASSSTSCSLQWKVLMSHLPATACHFLGSFESLQGKHISSFEFRYPLIYVSICRCGLRMTRPSCVAFSPACGAKSVRCVRSGNSFRLEGLSTCS